MRLAFYSDPLSPNGWYRAMGPMRALAARGHEVRQVVSDEGTVRPHLVRGCDALLVHRQHAAQALATMRYAKEAGIALVWDNDDDMTAVPRSDPSFREFGGLRGERVRAAVRRIVRMADLVTTPSPLLAERFHDLGAADVRVIENYVLDQSALRGGRREGSEVVVGWLAGAEHRIDADRLSIREDLRALLDARPDVRVMTIGVGLGLRGPRYEHIPQVDLEQLPARLATFDIGIAPIADIPFNRARSNVKLKEYAILGIPWLASPIGPYAGLGERQGGRLVPDDGWRTAIEALLTKPRERRRLAKRATAWAKRETLGAQARVWEQALADAVARAKIRA